MELPVIINVKYILPSEEVIIESLRKTFVSISSKFPTEPYYDSNLTLGPMASIGISVKICHIIFASVDVVYCTPMTFLERIISGIYKWEIIVPMDLFPYNTFTPP